MTRRPRRSGEVLRRLGATFLVLAAIAGVPASAAASNQPMTAAPASIGGGPEALGPIASATMSAGLAPAAATVGTFNFDLYRPDVFAMQATWWYCTAASVQIMRNIDRRTTDHSAAAQTRYFTYMHAHNMHLMAATDGIDPPGFLAGLRGYVDPRYQLVASTTFENAVRSAVLRLRASGLPVALIVDRGRHAWVLTGFSATADPNRTRSFRIVSVRIVGPLYGRQSRNGYDPAPDTRLSIDAFRRFLTPYDFKYGPTPWDDRFVTFQVAA